ALAADDSDVDAFLLFLHALRNPAALARFAAKAHAAGKPIIAYKLRRDPAVQAQHEAGIADATADAVADAFFAAQGIVRVDHFEPLLELAPMLVRRRPARGRPAALVSADECAGTMMADRLVGLGVPLDGLDDLARERLAESRVALPAGPVADISAAPQPDVLRAVLDEALDAPNNDVLLAVLASDAELNAQAAV